MNLNHGSLKIRNDHHCSASGEGKAIEIGSLIKAKDSPWDAKALLNVRDIYLGAVLLNKSLVENGLA